jgi:hypothetical protein
VRDALPPHEREAAPIDGYSIVEADGFATALAVAA